MATVRSSFTLVGSAIGLILAAGLLAGLTPRQEPAKPVFTDGQAQVVPAFSDPKEWIQENLWVETEFDSDHNGKKDRVHVDVWRQKQTQTEGLKVPVIYESSPYFAGTGQGDINWDVHQELGADPPPRTYHPDIRFAATRTMISRDFVAEWVPRGFAVVHSEAPGTGLSQGCPTVGGIPERFAPKAVIDWLNGRAKGYATEDGNIQVRATWCTGKVGMTGTSYNGTIPIAAATTGVDGLAAIIPVSPNTSYYHYYRANGLVRSPGGYLGEDVDALFDFIDSGDPAVRPTSIKLYRDGEFAKYQDRKHGDYNAFWAERDLLPFAKNIKCAVMMAHGLNDWNVMPDNSVRISLAVKGRVPLVQYFHQGGHGGEPPFPLMNKWFTRFLYGVQNGIENGPKAYIVREHAQGGAHGEPTPYADYPNPDAKPVELFPADGGATVGSLGEKPKPEQGVETLTDDVSLAAPTLAKADESQNRLIYATPELTAPVHISGIVRVTLRLASSTPAANLSVYLVQLPWANGPVGSANLITRSWADPQNWRALKGGDFHSMEPGQPLKAGEFVNFTFDLEPDDQIVPVGKRIGLMIFSSDHDFTLWPKPGTKLSIDLDATHISVPIVGGSAAFEHALAK